MERKKEETKEKGLSMDNTVEDKHVSRSITSSRRTECNVEMNEDFYLEKEKRNFIREILPKETGVI